MITRVAIDKRNIKESFSGKISKLMNFLFFVYESGIYGNLFYQHLTRFCQDGSYILCDVSVPVVIFCDSLFSRE